MKKLLAILALALLASPVFADAEQVLFTLDSDHNSLALGTFIGSPVSFEQGVSLPECIIEKKHQGIEELAQVSNFIGVKGQLTPVETTSNGLRVLLVLNDTSGADTQPVRLSATCTFEKSPVKGTSVSGVYDVAWGVPLSIELPGGKRFQLTARKS